MNNPEIDNMNRAPRFFLASSTAALVTMITPLAVGFFVFLGGPSPDADGTPDDAPYRAAGFLLLLTPLIFGLLLALWYSITRVLHSLGSLSKASIIVSCILISLTIGIVFAVAGYKAFGPKDAAISFSVFSGSTFVCLCLGFLTWWPIAFSGRKKRLHWIAEKSGSR
jgi:hypothetical protein